MNTNEVQTEPLSVQPGSHTANAPEASVEEKFAALFRQVHPPVPAANLSPEWVRVEREVVAERQGEI